MDTREGRELPSAGELDEETIARKRSRRVSFAEITAVHVFDRDDDDETPPSTGGGSRGEAEAGLPGGDHSDSEDSRCSTREEDDEDDEDDDDDEQERFIRDMDSSSPGSAVGSVTSNDDDNFFGPVSTSFIRSGRLSEAGMSDDNNHDITLDSTAFSLHFRNIAPLDELSASSAGTMMTPTGESIHYNKENFILPTGSKKSLLTNKFFNGSPSVNGGDSNSMSLVLDNSSKYDYGKLSPTLEKLLDEVNKSMLPNSSDSNGGVVNSVIHSGEASNGKNAGKQEKITHDAASADSEICVDLHSSNGSLINGITNKIGYNIPSPITKSGLALESIVEQTQETNFSAVKDFHGDTIEGNQSDLGVARIPNAERSLPLVGSMISDQSNALDVQQVLSKDQLSGNKHYPSMSPQHLTARQTLATLNNEDRILEIEHDIHTPKFFPQPFQLRLQGSVSSLCDERTKKIVDTAVISHRKLLGSDSTDHHPSPLELELRKNVEKFSAITDHILSKSLDTPKRNKSTLDISSMNHVSLESEGAPKNRDVSNIEYGCLPLMGMETDLFGTVKKDREAGLTVESGQSGILDSNGIDGLLLTEEHVSKSAKATYLSSETDKLSSLISNNIIEGVITHHGHSQIAKSAEHCEVIQNLNTSNRVEDQEQCSFLESPVRGDSSRKRTRLNPVLESNHASKISRTEDVQISSEHANVGPKSSPECIDASHVVSQQPMKDWSDILAKALETTTLVFSPNIIKLSLHEVEVLENSLDKLQMGGKYRRLSSSLKSNDNFADIHHKRVAEAKLLLDKLLFEKAKMQLKRIKLEQLHGCIQRAQAGALECHKIKSMFSHICLQSTRTSHEKNLFHQEENHAMKQRKQELKLLEQKVDHLLKSFEVRCKIKENMDYNGIVEVVNKYLQKKNCLRSIHQDLRLWELINIVRRDGEHEIVLNYSNWLFQRFIIKGGQAPSVVVGHQLNNAIIGKIFPNMNACTAFDFIFKANDVSRLASLKCFQQKTVETSLILGNLVDVLEEVQIAAMDIVNLTCSSFSCKPSGDLELRLCIINFRSSQKVTLSINMSNLACAVYPSEPSELKYTICEPETTLPSLIMDNITAAIKSLKGGQLVILRICRSISKVVQASTS